MSSIAATPVQQYRWLCIDIETANARPEDAEHWARLAWSPSAQWKAETIGSRYLEAVAKKKERLALLDESPIACIGLRSDTEVRCLHAITGKKEAPVMDAGALVEGFATQRDMLVAFRGLLESFVNPETILVGHNIVDFDLPKLRWTMIRSGVRLPEAIITREQPVYDTMREFCARYTIAKDIMISVDDVLADFGLPSHKGVVDGAQIPELVAKGDRDTVVRYCLLDVFAESNLFLLMTGQGEEREPTTAAQAPASPPQKKEAPQARADTGAGF